MNGSSLIRVLYLDDDDALVRLVQKTLGRQGFEVIHAASAEFALEVLTSDLAPVHVLALDHYLPGSTGLDFLDRLASLGCTVPVVYVTGTSEMNVAVSALKAGATDFVPKTVGDDFLILLRSALEQAVEKARLKVAKEEADEQVRRSRDRAELFLAEMNHRVANSLSLVASLVNLQANAIEDQVAKDALAETQGRIYAIALVHRRLYASGEVSHVDLDEYISGLVEHLAAAMNREGHGASLVCDVAPLNLGTDSSISLGIVVTEWVTNAFKYAYAGGAPGEIRVRLRSLPDGRGELAVEDDGVGRDSVPARKGTGLGTRIVKAMALRIGADIAYEDLSPGTGARLFFALPAGG